MKQSPQSQHPLWSNLKAFQNSKLIKSWNKSLLIKLTASFFLLFLITIFLISYAAFNQGKQALKTSVFQRLSVIASLKENEINRWLEHEKDELLSLNIIYSFDKNSPLIFEPESSNKTSDFLKSFIEDKNEWKELYLLNTSGIIVSSSKKENIGKLKIFKQEDLKEQLLASSFFICPVTNEPLINLLVPFKDEKGKLLGLIGVDLSLEVLEEIVITDEKPIEDMTYLVANIGNGEQPEYVSISPKILNSQKFLNSIDSNAIREAMDGKDGQGLYLNYQGKEVIGVYRWLDKHKIALILEIEQTLAFAPAKKLAATIFWIGFLLGVLIAIATLIIATQITLPIIALTHSATQLASGNLTATVSDLPLKRKDEIGILARAFIQMREQLKLLYEDLDHKVQERTSALVKVNQQLQIEITERKITEVALQQAKEAAEAASQVKTKFLTNITHELRTPLNAILGYTQLLLRDSSLSISQQENLNIINRRGEHLLALINDLLQMSKIESGIIELKMEVFDLYELLNNLEETLQLKVDAKQLKLIFECDRSLPQYIETDKQKLHQVLLNLLINAIKFTEFGSVILKVTRSELSADCLEFIVEDTGFGIACYEINNLFQPFIQSEIGKRTSQGTGLGLAISQKFVELMGGTIKVNSFLGQGSIFSFTLKVKFPEIPVKLGSVIVNKKVIGLDNVDINYRILVVDTDWENRKLLTNLLSLIGFEVKEAIKTNEVIALWENWDPDLILMDTLLPLRDGHQALQYIKFNDQKDKKTVIIALNTPAFASEEKYLLRAGYDDLLRKPAIEQVLFAKIAQHLEVSYIYEKHQQVLVYHPATLTCDSLAFMPSQWRDRLCQSAAAADAEEIIKLLSEIPEAQNLLKTTLLSLCKNFQFDQIMELVC